MRGMHRGGFRGHGMRGRGFIYRRPIFWPLWRPPLFIGYGFGGLIFLLLLLFLMR